MKKGILVMLCLCIAVAAYSQKKKTKTKKAAAKTAAPVAAPPANNKVDVTQTALADTTKKNVRVVVMDMPVDGYYKKPDLTNAEPIAYAPVRQADVIFAKRIWEEIDVREKLNKYMAAPQARLIDVLVDAIKNEELRAFDASPTKESPGGDDFKTLLSGAQAMSKLADSVMVEHIDSSGNKTGAELKMGEFDADSIVKFRIKEDWIFDKQRSVWEVRIIGIAPLIRIKVAGISLDYQPAFWVYFPEARAILASKSVFIQSNDATNLNYDQVFLKRRFSSYIVKQSNEKDERIKDYAQGIDRLYESERIKKSLMDWELNLWQY